MIRTILYTFFLITCLILTPCAILAGTDDSGLQVFTVDFSKQLGESADVAQEDTLLSPYCYNMFSSGNGLCSFAEPNGTGYEWAGLASDIVTSDNFNSYNFVRLSTAGGSGSAEIYLHVNPNMSPASAVRTLISSNNLDYLNSEMQSFETRNAVYLFTGTKLLKVTGSPFSPTTTEITLPTTGSTATVWNNRIFFASGSTIYYSAPQNFEDYSNTSTTGGTTNIYECYQIFKIIGTRYGLYIFTDNGVFLQSGTGSKNSWSIEKISDLIAVNFRYITSFNDIIYFGANSYQSVFKIFSISGAVVTEFCEVPSGFYTTDYLYHYLQMSNDGRFLCFFTITVGGTSWMYDVQRKTFVRNAEFNGGGSHRYYIKRTATSYKMYEFPSAIKYSNLYSYSMNAYYKTIYPWAYQTSWLTLDGNASTRKEIDRIEFDYQGGTTAVSLYYAYGNGSSTYSSTTLTAPINTRLSTYVWNAPIGKQQSNRFYLYFLSSGTQTMTTNYILKQARIYYRNIGNYKTNSLR